MDKRAEFEAWASHFFFRGELDRHGINGARPGEYRVLHIERMWGAWQAATQRQQERIAYVEKIAEDAIELCTQQANRVMELEAQVQALSVDAERLDWLTFHLSGKALRDIGVIWSEHADARAAIDAAIAAGKGEG